MAEPEDDEEEKFAGIKDDAGQDLKDRTGTMAGPPLAD